VQRIRTAQEPQLVCDFSREHTSTRLDVSRLQDGSLIIQIRDITTSAQKEAEPAEVRSILERIGDAYIAFDTEWRYSYVNHKAAELALKPASELIGRCVWDEFPEAADTLFFSELQRSMREQIPVQFDNYYAPLGKWFENSVYPSPAGVSVFYRDITQRVRTQRALERSAADLARKNSELEMFAYVASHDLQEPLRAIRGFADLLNNRYSGRLDADANEFLAFIIQGAERMQHLITNLLTLCRFEQGNAAPLARVSLEHAVRIVCSNLNLAIEDRGATILFGTLPDVTFSETQLVQLLQNLISNALKYRSAAPPRIEVHAERGDTGWTICVRDNGAGFDMQHAEQIFKPFKRLQADNESGTGIGLAICKRIVENRGGRIWVTSVPGTGSTFFFTIPDD
jgi:PAS domain S-box-containing protein